LESVHQSSLSSNLTIPKLNIASRLRGVAEESGNSRYQYGCWIHPLPEQCREPSFSRMDLTGTRCHPHLRRQELIQKMLKRGRRVFNASNINLLSISFNLFALGPFHIFPRCNLYL
jgi:hypothetical protein